MPDSHTPESNPFANHRRIRPRGIHRLFHDRSWILADDDELVYIRIEGATEHCRRIRLNDIQAFITHPTRAAAWGTAALVVVLLALAWGAWAGAHEPVFLTAWMIAAGIVTLFLFLHVLMGPTCTTHIVTAVQTIPLSTVSRLYAATQLFASLRPLVLQAQGVAVATAFESTESSEPPTVRDFT